jgi:hypothetical protein
VARQVPEQSKENRRDFQVTNISMEIHAIETFDRILFPIIFASFNLVYWVYYLTKEA